MIVTYDQFVVKHDATVPNAKGNIEGQISEQTSLKDRLMVWRIDN